MKTSSSVLAALLLAAACGQSPAPPAETPPPAAETVDPAALTAELVAYLNDVFDAQVARNPQFQTFLGIKTDYDKWNDVSQAAQLETITLMRDAVSDMKARFDYDGLTPEGQLSYRLFETQLAQDELAYAWRNHWYAFHHFRAPHSSMPAFLINQHKVTSLEDADAYLARLSGVPAYFAQNMDNARLSGEMGVRPPKFSYDAMLESIDNLLAGYPFEDVDTPTPILKDFRAKVAGLESAGEIDAEKAAELLAAAETALTDEVGPAYRELRAFLAEQREAADEDDGAWSLPEGGDYYAARLKMMTTTDMTAEEIHDLGLAEMDRIHGEMRAIMADVGYDGTLQDFFEFLRTDPQFYYPNTDEGRDAYLAEATALIDAMRDALPSAFNTFPEADVIVKRVEPFREQAAGKAFYQSPALDGSRPGIYYANLYRMDAMPTYQMAALAYHEGIPGHHMQRAISQELTGIPEFRKYLSATAYTEGWGLYTEYLPKEMGFYDDPYSDFGRLAMELWRAARLVVDTGLHDKQWTREEAVQYLVENTPNPESDCRKAIDRYIVMPGQATAYKIGMNKILELREAAKAALGEDFDLGEYHDVVLTSGPVPLSILEERVEAWIEAKGA